MFDKRPLRVVGAMSGTSLDGVDVAEIVTDGEVIFDFGTSSYVPYSEAPQGILRAALGQWQDGDIAEAAQVVQDVHLEALTPFKEAELIGFHGQTLAHDPRGRGTHQIGDGAALAQALGRPVAWDFRSADVGIGGQGAPLAPFFHFACAKWIEATGPIAFLNLGGVGNITWVDPLKAAPEERGALIAFDTGPANAPINDLMRARLSRPYDQDGATAAQGRVVEGALELFLEAPYFRKLPPKSLDRNDFSVMLDLVRELNTEDAVATLTSMVAASVMQAMEHCPIAPKQLLVTGGGRHNPVMMQMIAACVECEVIPVEEVGLDGDMLEAQAFAYLAARVARGLATSAPMTTGVPMLVGGGVVSYPDGD